jgi:glycosyltransferase involved in cell wall biosynthesis
MNISMIVCTYNRVELLKKTISSLLKQTIIQKNNVKWEIIIVNNNSTDGTEEYLLELANNNKNLQYVLEKNQGLGYARNAAIRAAQYDILAYIDDDEWAEPTWAEEIIRVFADNYNVGCVAGPYYLENKESLPFWISPALYGVLGDVWLETNQEDYSEMGRVGLGGGNLAIRKEVCLKLGGFPLLGRKGEILLSDEDTLMCYAIYDAGYRLFYNPKAIVHHVLIPSRVKLSYFMRHAKGMAYTRARKEKMHRYLFELIWHIMISPFKIILNYRNILQCLMRVASAKYKFEKSLSLYFNN